MGNCIDLQKPILWVDDEDWELPEPGSPAHCREKEEKARRATTTATRPPEPVKEKNQEVMGSTEIKVKVSKMQLEELLRQVEEKGLPLKKVLADLVGIGDETSPLENSDGHDHWRPNLQSIPEVSE